MRSRRNFAGLWQRAIWLLLPICLSAGCGRRVEYVNSDHRLTKLKEGQPAPRPGVLVSEGYLSEMYDAMDKPRPALKEGAKVGPENAKNSAEK